MRKLSECKNYFKDLLFNCLDENGFDKSPFDCTERAQYETFINTLKHAGAIAPDPISGGAFYFPAPREKGRK